MRIGLISEQSKRELMQNFSVAYKLLLAKHTLYATGVTARKIEEASSLKVNSFLPGEMGGIMQMVSLIEREELDAVIFLYTPGVMLEAEKEYLWRILHLCDQYCIPLATNIASAEILILGIENGDLSWKET